MPRTAWPRFLRRWTTWATRAGTGYRPRFRPCVQPLEDRMVPGFGGGVSVAGGDVNGDGYADLVTGAGPGGGPHVRVISGRDGSDLSSFFAYAPGFTGGVAVAVGDVTGDGAADVVTGAGPGGGPHVRVFDGRTGTEIGSFSAFDPAFGGGVAVAVADLDADGYADIVTGAGPGGSPHVRVVSGKDRSELMSFFAFDPGFAGGVSVAGGDVNGDGRADVVAGAGPGGGPRVRVVSGRDGTDLADFFAYEPGFVGGVTVATAVNGGRADILTAPGAGGGPRVRAFDVAGDGTALDLMVFDPAFRGGVMVAGVDLDADGRADLVAAPGAGGRAEVRLLSADGLRERARFTAYAPPGSPGGFSVFAGTPPAVPPVPPTLPPTLPPAVPPVVPPNVPPTVPPPPPTVPPVVPPVVPPTVPPPPPAVSMADFSAGTAFLYTGPDAVQTGVAAGTIDPRRAAVVRGRVTDRSRQPLPGVAVSVLGRPEFGRTITQADGWFSLAVNGGGPLSLDYAKDGFLPSQRQVDAPWRDYEIADEVVLVPLDARVTTVDLASTAAPFQVARGNPVTDSDGTRQATLLFPQGVTATLTLADGSTRPISTLNVRATEYTVGDTGPAAMPGTLPPTSGYTYAVELSVDEGLAAGATEVTFSRPVPFYVENFLNFPVGMAVPAGYYDRQRGVWVPSDNGRVVRVVSEAGGTAAIDVDGDGVADSGATLTALGVTDAELVELARLYDPGAGLWRVPVPHFTPWDCNWPFGPPNGARPPGVNPNELKPTTPNKPSIGCGSVIQIESQTLGESIPVTGAPFQLVYQSDRVPGRTDRTTLTIPLTRDTLPAGLKRVELTVKIAGRIFKQSQAAEPNQRASFTWDEIDWMGRTVIGEASATVKIDYVYDAVYYEPANFSRAFAELSGVPITGNPARQEVTLSQTVPTYMGSGFPQAAALGGWMSSVVNAYSPADQMLYLGTGETIRVATYYGQVIDTVAGHSGPSDLASVRPNGVAVGPDGSIYIANLSRIFRVGRDGVIVTIAGNGFIGVDGDGGPATEASIAAEGIALGPDGSIYIVASDEDFSNTTSSRVRRVGPDGVITTVAGDGSRGFTGDGGPATQASVSLVDVAVGPDGSLYIADWEYHRVRRVGPDGVITTVAGNGSFEFEFSGDGGPATQASLLRPAGIDVGPDGSLYIADSGNNRVRRVGPDGVITTVAGNGSFGFSGDGGPATRASVVPGDTALGPDGTLFINDYGMRVRRVSPAMQGFNAGDITIPSEDGSQLYRFNSTGRHLQTLDSLTRTPIYTFGYDSAGRLLSVTDADNGVTTIERNASGTATAIVGPDGHRTTLEMNADGYLTRVTNPAGESYRMAYGTGGLLTSFTDPLENTSRMTYDALGRLTQDDDPADGFTRLERQELGGGSYKVVTTNAVDRVESYSVENLPDGRTRRTTVDGRGFSTVTLIGTDGSETVTAPDGTVTTTVYGPDPRFGMLAPVVTSQTVRLPSGLTATMTGARTATFAVAGDTASPLRTLTDTVTVNGKTFRSVYDAAARTVTTTSAEGRTTVTTADEKGRIVRAEVPGVLPVSYAYDARGRMRAVTQGDRTVTYAYDARGNLATITDPLSRTTELEYDLADRITKQTQPDGSVITFRYDREGKMLGLTPPGRPEHTFGYNSRDLLTTTTAPDVGPGDETARYVYNLARQLVQENLPGGASIDYAYCACGRLTSITAPWGNYTYTYSTTTGQLTSLASPGGFTLTAGYDGGLTTSETLAGPVAGGVNWTYDSNFRVVTEAVNGANPVTFAYDGDGLLTRAGGLTLTRDATTGRLTGTALGVVSDTVSYDAYGDRSGYTARIGQTAALAYTHTRDLLGRITGKTETANGVTTTTEYGYDDNGQLVTVTVNGLRTQTYSYDANGNRLSLATPAGTETGTYDAQDRLITYGGRSYTYTEDGFLQTVTDPATGRTTRYTYDSFGNLTRVQLPDGRDITYLIDGDNRRVGKRVNGTLVQGLLYNGQLTPVAEVDAAGAVVTRFVYATGVNVPAYMVRGGVTYRLATDDLGSVRLVVNTDTGEVAQRLEYDAFGRVVIDTNPGFQPFGYAGGLYDPDTGLVRFGARDYDVVTGRWTADDPISFLGSDANLYRYAFNSPVHFFDPSGTNPLLWAAARVVGAALLAILSDPDTIDSPGRTPAEFAAEQAIDRLGGALSGKATGGVCEAIGKSTRKPGKLGQFKGRDALRSENQIPKDVMKKLGLHKDKDKVRQLHDEISGEGLSFDEILRRAREKFGRE